MTAIAPSNSRGGMGWRKPVPVYIPTPPSSRPTSDSLFTPAPVLPGGDVAKRLAAEGPKDSLPPVSPLFAPRFPPAPVEKAGVELTLFQMPDDWLSIVRSVSQDFYHDSSRFRLAVGSAVPERQPVYAVCQLYPSGSSPAAQRLFLGVFPDCVLGGSLPPLSFSASLYEQRRLT